MNITKDNIVNIYGTNYLSLDPKDMEMIDEVGNEMGWPFVNDVQEKYPCLNDNQLNYYRFARADLLIGDSVNFDEERPGKYIADLESLAGVKRKLDNEWIIPEGTNLNDISAYWYTQYIGTLLNHKERR